MAVVTRRSASLRLGARSKVRAQWLVLAAALTVLAGVVVAWALSRAAARIDVVAAARPVASGTEIVSDDLIVVAVAADGVTGLVPAAQRNELVGRIAAVPVEAGSLVIASMLSAGAEVRQGEHAVGALLRPGRLPERLGVASTALAVSIDITDATTGEAVPRLAPVPVRVVTAARLDTGETSLVLAVPAADAPAVARLAATDQLVLVGVPAVQAGAPDDSLGDLFGDSTGDVFGRSTDEGEQP